MRGSRYQMTLGELIAALDRKDKDKPVTFGWNYCEPTTVHSYRGDYADLAIGYDKTNWDKRCTVESLLKTLNDANGQTFTGYKGGEYFMDVDTLMWADPSNQACRMAIVDVVDVGHQIWLKTEYTG